jgi:hypothetical protein
MERQHGAPRGSRSRSRDCRTGTPRRSVRLSPRTCSTIRNPVKSKVSSSLLSGLTAQPRRRPGPPSHLAARRSPCTETTRSEPVERQPATMTVVVLLAVPPAVLVGERPAPPPTLGASRDQPIIRLADRVSIRSKVDRSGCVSQLRTAWRDAGSRPKWLHCAVFRFVGHVSALY